MMQNLLESLRFWSYVILIIAFVLCTSIFGVFVYYSGDLPDYKNIENKMPSMPTKIYAQNGMLIDEIVDERRISVKIDNIPKLVINAFLAAEDRSYYSHPGVDIASIARAAIQNIANKSKRSVGGSTITQQVVKNLLLTNERTISRKIKEAILAYRINKHYSKNKILEIYLNFIYLGNRSYGIASAAENYFNKTLQDLTLEEAAVLATLPKAPSKINPIKSPQKAKIRRDWVISRMLDEGFVTKEEASEAIFSPIKLQEPSRKKRYFDAPYFAEHVKQILVDNYEDIRHKSMAVHTSLDALMQRYADIALRRGLVRYDLRHGFRGPIARLEEGQLPKDAIEHFSSIPGKYSYKIAVVTAISEKTAVIELKDQSKGYIYKVNTKWARKALPNGEVGDAVKSMQDVLSVGDIILVQKSRKGDEYYLRQIPKVNGAIIVMQTRTGRVLAVSGGYNYHISNFNRAIQSKRQPGSAFKPFVYLAALESGYYPNDVVSDEPIELEQGFGLPVWMPRNYDRSFKGDITLRYALEKSRNVATVKLLTVMGFESVISIAKRLGIYYDPPKNYSMALGAFETTLLDITNAYNIIASDGMKTEPSFIDRIHKKDGTLIYAPDILSCKSCKVDVVTDEQIKQMGDEYQIPEPYMHYKSERIIDEVVNYQIKSMLEGSVLRGSSRRAQQIGKTVAGKTGTTNDTKDAWFIGFSPEITVGIYVGYDAPQNMGEKEQGASIALPIFVDFMKNSLAKSSNQKFSIPEGIEFVKIDYKTGQESSAKSGVIFEAFKKSEKPHLPDTLKSDDEADITTEAEDLQGIY